MPHQQGPKGASSPPANLPEGAVRVLQITDTHLYSDPSQCLLGLNTLQSLDQILEQAKGVFSVADMILATGDLVHDSSGAGYRRVSQRLTTLGCPVYGLPGNHDIPEAMRDGLNGTGMTAPRLVQKHAWSVVFLDSTLPDSEGGHLSEEELIALENCLSEHPDKHTLIALHHHPVSIGSAWMDEMTVDNAAQFFRIVDRHPQIRCILWGHIHQDYDAWHRDIRLLGSPSTCIQFKPAEDDFSVDERPPGFRWLILMPDGSIKTGIQRLDAYPSEIELRSAGY